MYFRSGATGGIPGPCLPNHCLCPTKRELCLLPPPPSEDCASNKVTGSVQLECSSRPETSKILVITSVLQHRLLFFFCCPALVSNSAASFLQFSQFVHVTLFPVAVGCKRFKITRFLLISCTPFCLWPSYLCSSIHFKIRALANGRFFLIWKTDRTALF